LGEVKAVYERVVLSQAHTLGHAESVMRVALFLAPGRYSSSEVLAEAGYACVSAVSLWHDLLVCRYLQRKARLRRAPLDDPVLVRGSEPLLIGLTLLQHTELFLEIAALHKIGDRARWILVFVVELLKAVLRIMLLIKGGGAMLIQHTIPERNDILTEKNAQDFTLEEIEQTQKSEYNEKHNIALSELEQLSNVALTTAKPRRRGPRETLLKSAPISLLDPSRAASSKPTRTALLVYGEYLYILRPVVYLIGMYLFGRLSWVPWLASLGVDAVGSWYSSSSRNMNQQERNEISRRRMQWLYYVLRSPFFETCVTNGPFAALLAKRLPGFGAILDYVEAYRRRYFYIAGSSV